MKKALGIWMLLVALLIGGVFFALGPEKNSGFWGNKGTQEDSVINTRAEKYKYFHINQINSSLKGETIITSGVVTEITEKKDIVFFTLKDVNADRVIKCVMFKKTNTDNVERKKLLEKSASAGLLVNLEGEVDIYKNDLEIKVWKVFTK